MISALILTKNEEKNIKECLATLKWCDEIIVIDDYSEDRTIEIAEKYGAKVYERRLASDFASQRNFGLQKTQGSWIFFIDADERASPELRREVLKSLKVKGFNGFYLKRNDFFGGRWLNHGETAGVRLLRLGRKGTGEWQRQVHEVWKIKGKIGELKQPILHYPHPTISEFLKNINFYSSLHAEVLYKEGVKSNLLQIITYPLAKFIQNWIFRLGFLDMGAGLIVALMMSLHSFLARAKLYLKWKS